MSTAAYNRGSRIVSRGADERMPMARFRADQWAQRLANPLDRAAGTLTLPED